MTNNLPDYDFSVLDTLSEKERAYALEILKEYSKRGKSEKLEQLLYEDYKEIPVTIEEFLSNDNYLGKAWKDAAGNSKVYPFWLDTMKKIFPNNIDTDYNTLLETGARGLGKSEVACGMVGAYLMYRVLCLKNPLEYYRLKPTEKIVFAFMNIKLELAEQIAVDKFQKTVQMSPWFMARGKMTQRNNRPYWVPPEPVNIVIGSQSDDVLGQPIFFAFFDEISFIRNQDIDRQKEKAKDMIDTAVGGMVTRFIHNGKNPTMLVVASSKRSEQSFMEEYIKTLSESEGTNVYVVDKPVWEVKPEGTYGEDIFYVGLGNKYLSSIVIPDEDVNLLDLYRTKGYKILEVPRFFRAKFLEDIERNLCDIAGISTTSLNKYMSAEIVVGTINEEYKNPFPDIITVGNAPNDLAQYKNFFNMDNIPRELMEKPLFVHLDMSISGDMTGIAGVWIVGKKVTTGGDPARDLFYRVAFSTSVEAPKGYQVSFEKNRNFIRWLREAGFRVKEVTSDTFQSYDLQQQLKAEGFNCSILSVDRVDPSSRVCVPYQHLKSVVYEKRMSMYNSKRLLDEFLDIERNIDNGKIDHSRNGHKDALDAVCGAIFTASKYAEEYAFDYGETLDTIKTVSANHDYASEREQIAVDFQNELNKMFGSSGHSQDNKKSNEKSDGFTDFGFGKSVPLQTQYLANGIVVI